MSLDVTSSISLPATPTAVWDVVMDPRRLEDWVTIHEALGDVPAGKLRRGSAFEQTLRLGGRSFKVRWKVTQLDHPDHAEWEGKGPAGSRARAIYSLAEADGGTRFDYVNRFDFPGGPLGALAGRIVGRAAAQREAKKSLQKLRRLFEDG